MSGTKNRRGWGWVRKRSSGRYQASYIGPDNVRHFAPTTFEHKIDAEEWLTDERRAIQEAKKALKSVPTGGNLVRLDWMSPEQRDVAADESFKSQMTLAEYGEKWITERKLAPRTRIDYQRILASDIGPKLGSVMVSNLRPAMIRSWFGSMDPDKQKTRANAYTLLNSICKTAVADELLQSNPCMVQGATVVKGKRDPVVPSITEMAVIADKIEAKFKALVLISAWCGLRFGEAIELRRKDICYVGTNGSAEPGVVAVERGVTHRNDGNGQRCHVGPPKSGKTRKVPIPPHIRAAIDQHLEQYVDCDPNALLFKPVRNGCHVSDRVVRDAFRDACDAANVSQMRLHDMRHFAGHQTARVGNLVETMARLGHTTQSASLRYQGMVSGRDVAIADALSELANS
ncbi:tyrosine-type recombinase/integrase [Mycobacterium avium]|uniref:tyrosine-type recombinase/integrase n=1 Tax=Mycobacterium avium TaxID=1764 RepID=UPI001CDC62A0|nr:site-specific integrase [Mycobacterium avium]MCA4731007.1 site-specific integrase [Mycobacterium avium subsp. hominissuis]MDO2359925.1 tyrosine-type recombinase/integrase [Mycobacterium avium subsp. hominissuis]UBV03745.1 site-specific integrase [Mycobacterium avium subsp. hominissuis]